MFGGAGDDILEGGLTNIEAVDMDGGEGDDRMFGS